jgi:hypothetical protein
MNISKYYTMKNFLGLLLVIVSIGVLSLGSVHEVHAQQGEQQPQSPQLTAKDSLEIASAENKTLETILRSIESIDTARQNELIQWIITDRTIRSRVLSALRKSGYKIAPNSVAEMTVTQKPPTGDNTDMTLLRIVVEQIGIYGEPNIRRILGSTLYDEINSRQNYEFTLISTAPEQEKIQFIKMNASLFGGDMIFKSGFGFAINVGDDYDGYPFWLPGTIGTYGIVNDGLTDFRIGVEWPLGESGETPFVVSQGLQIRQRLLVGAEAFDVGLKQDLGVLQTQSGKLGFGAEFRDAFTPSITSFPTLALQPQYETDGPTNRNGIHGAADSLYYLALSAHAYLSYSFPNQTLPGAYVQLGGGFHAIQPVTVGQPPYQDPTMPNTDLYFDTRQTYFDPFIKLGYVHSDASGELYSVSVQYSNTLLTDAWVRLFSWLEIEAKYATVIGRNPYPWEWKDYVMVSPKLIFNF